MDWPALVGVVADRTGGTGNQLAVCGGNANDCGGGGGTKWLRVRLKLRGEIGGEMTPPVFNKNGGAPAFNAPFLPLSTAFFFKSLCFLSLLLEPPFFGESFLADPEPFSFFLSDLETTLVFFSIDVGI